MTALLDTRLPIIGAFGQDPLNFRMFQRLNFAAFFKVFATLN